jgi:uncharacterized protein with GYD domain
MAKYVILMNWTDQGVKTAKDTVKRYKDAAALMEKMGGKLGDVYWTVGAHDIVAIADAPDDETLSAGLLTLAASGNLRSTTMRAFSASEMEGVIAKMPS